MATTSYQTARGLVGSPSAAGSKSGTRNHRAETIDALGWFILPTVLLTWLHVGRLSGDGLVQTQSYLAQTWRLNPNHLLYEPLGAGWLRSIMRIHLARPAVDQMLLLSVLAGGITLGLFRRFIADRAPTRLAANAATAWVGFFAAFLSLWLSSEAQMVQMPWLVASFAGALAYAERPTTARSAFTGLAIGAATLFYVSNALLALSIPILLAIGGRFADRRYAVRELAVMFGTTVLVAAVGFVAAWLVTAAGTLSFAAWLTSYGGGHGSARIAATYGVHGFAELPIAIARAVYGTALGMVDISGAVADIRTRGAVGVHSMISVAVCLWVFIVLAYSTVRGAVIDRRDSRVLLISIAWLGAVFAFAVFWNNSDDQFYFQMAIAFGALVTASWSQRTRTWLIGATVALVGWNGLAAWRELISYPRDEYVNKLTATVRGAGLVIFPGSDEIMQLMYFVPTGPGQQRVNITSVAGTLPASRGLPEVDSTVACTLSRGSRVVMLDVATPGEGDSWRALDLLGYPRQLVMASLDSFSFRDAGRIGPFVARELAPKKSNGSAACRHAPSEGQ